MQHQRPALCGALLSVPARGYHAAMLMQKLSTPPDLLALHAADPAFFPCLLQSAAGLGWDILMAAPQQQRLYCGQDQAQTLWRDLSSLPLSGVADARFPFSGGWFAYLGYELLHVLEPAVATWPQTSFPLACLMRIPAAIVYERGSGTAWAIAEEGFEAEWRELCQRTAATGCHEAVLATCVPRQVTEEEPQAYLDGVERIRRYIREGDVFQVNLSRAWRAQIGAATPAAVYRQLRQVNPGPFNALAHLGDASIISSSPERLLSVRDGRVSTRPIAGTHPRSVDAAEDAALKARLIGSSKERAEHIMLIDLERNDLGRICQPGSVRVEELMSVETYAFVHHIESVVSGQLRAGVAPAAAIAALFPGGTITGCPKVRTMQIIRELESGPRGAYTGSLGYINGDGSMDFNILIRSFMQQEEQLHFRAGAGVVADSQPERELAETRAKAKGLLRALEVPHVAG